MRHLFGVTVIVHETDTHLTYMAFLCIISMYDFVQSVSSQIDKWGYQTMGIEVIRIGKFDEVEGDFMNMLSPLERKQILIAAGKAKAAAIESNPNYIKPELREDRYYARSRDGNVLYWFTTAHRRDDWVFWTGGTVVSPSLEETWSAVPYRHGDKFYYARSMDGTIYRFVSIARRDGWANSNSGVQYWPKDQEDVQSIWGAV